MTKEHFPYMAIVGVVAVVAIVVLLLSLRTTVQAPAIQVAEEGAEEGAAAALAGEAVKLGGKSAVARGCSDSDGADTNVKGTTSGRLALDVSKVGKKGQFVKVMDKCEGYNNEQFVWEWLCNNDQVYYNVKRCQSYYTCINGRCEVAPTPKPNFKMTGVGWLNFPDDFGPESALPDYLRITAQNTGETANAPEFIIVRAYPVIVNAGESADYSSLMGIFQLGDQGVGIATEQRIWYSPVPLADVQFNSNPYDSYAKGTVWSGNEGQYVIETAVALYKVDSANTYPEENEADNCGLYHAEDNTFEALETCPEEWGGIKLSDYE
ncbi:MAG: hypothetical protein AABX13_02355 [Nanoarchaeota archaeon]